MSVVQKPSNLTNHLIEEEIEKRISFAEEKFFFKTTSSQRKRLITAIKKFDNHIKTYDSAQQLRYVEFANLQKHPMNRAVDVQNLINIILNKIMQHGHIPYEIITDDEYRVAIHQHLAIVRYLLGIPINYIMVTGITPKHIYGETSAPNKPQNIVQVMCEKNPKMRFLDDTVKKYKELAKVNKDRGNITLAQVVGGLLNEPSYLGGFGRIDKSFILFESFPDYTEDDIKRMDKFLEVMSYMNKRGGYKRFIGRFMNFSTVLLKTISDNDNFSPTRFIYGMTKEREKIPTFGIADGSEFQIRSQICEVHNFDLRTEKTKIS